MIDTDKYEGHTEGPWMWYRDDGDVDLVVANDQCHTVLEEVKALYSEANENLIADAPLLLAEVKRLRRVDKTTSKYLSFALSLLTDEQDCEYTHFVGGLCTHYCCPHGDEEE